MPREILTEWTGPQGSGMLSVMYFIEGTAVADQRAALNTFWSAVDARLSNLYSWSIATSGREIDEATGVLTGEWVEATPYTGTGAGSAVVADATQALVRWNTGTVINGRFLKGRTYIPGLAAANMSGGNIASAAAADIQAAADALISAAVQLAVWHRPVQGAGGDARGVDSASVWTELAVQRRRRG